MDFDGLAKDIAKLLGKYALIAAAGVGAAVVVAMVLL
jgi:hypothetical protein